MDSVLRGLQFCFCYLYNILIASDNPEEHTEHVLTIPQRLQEHGIKINASKCIFGVSEIPFLDYLVSENGILPLLEKVKAILLYKKPVRINELQRFLGIINYYRQCLKDAAKNPAVLNKYLKDSRKNDGRLIAWSTEAEKAFDKCKQDLANVTQLAHPAASVPLILTTDASNTSIRATLEQHINGKVKPIAFFSKKLNNTQKKYSANDRELIEIFELTKHFKHMQKVDK